jgi:hypothetical protein
MKLLYLAAALLLMGAAAKLNEGEPRLTFSGIAIVGWSVGWAK